MAKKLHKNGCRTGGWGVDVVQPGFKLLKTGKKYFFGLKKPSCSVTETEMIVVRFWRINNFAGFEDEKNFAGLKLTLNKTFPSSWEKKYFLLRGRRKQILLTKLLVCWRKEFFSCKKIFFCPTNGWFQLISDRLNESGPKISLGREFNLRIRKLGIVHLARGVCHKSCFIFFVNKRQKITGNF